MNLVVLRVDGTQRFENFTHKIHISAISTLRAWCLYSSMISAAQSELASALWEVRVASAATQVSVH